MKSRSDIRMTRLLLGILHVETNYTVVTTRELIGEVRDLMLGILRLSESEGIQQGSMEDNCTSTAEVSFRGLHKSIIRNCLCGEDKRVEAYVRAFRLMDVILKKALLVDNCWIRWLDRSEVVV